MTTTHLDTSRHPITDDAYIARCRDRLDRDGALVLEGFARSAVIAEVVAASAGHEATAYYTDKTHNVYLTPSDQLLDSEHVFNRQIMSSKGLIADDEIPADSPLREVYDSEEFRTFLCGVLGIEQIFPYADQLSSINVHFAAAGMELGWHFDNSSFAVTMLLQAPTGGGGFEYVPAVRDADMGDMAYDRVGAILDGLEQVEQLSFRPGDLVLFRGRNAIHRVTPTVGAKTRMLVVFAYNHEPNVTLSDSALATFYGRSS